MYAWLRRLLVLTFAAVIFGAGGLGWFAYLHYTDPETIRRLILEMGNQNFPGGRLSLTSVDGRLIGGLELKGLLLSDLTEESAPASVFQIASCTIVPDHHRLLEGSLEIRKAILVEPVLDLRQTPTGEWNISKWVGKKPIRLSYGTTVVIKNGTLKIAFSDPSKQPLELTHINLEISLKAPSEIVWSGTMRHMAAPELRSAGRGDLAAKQFRGDLATVAPVDIGLLLHMLPPEIRDKLGAETKLGGQLMFQAVLDSRQEDGELLWSGSCAGRIKHGTVEHAQLPYPIRGAESEFFADRNGLRIAEFKARCGQAVAELTASFPNWDIELAHGRGDVWNLPFDDRLYEILPLKHQQAWERVSPRGAVDLHGSLRRADERWQLAGYADLHDCTASFFKFPYRVRDVQGRIVLHPDGHVSLQCRGKARQAPVALTGTFSGIRTGAGMDLRITASGLVPDEELLAALPPAVVDTIAKLHGDVHGDAVVVIQRAEGIGKPVEWTADLDLAAPTFTCDWFKYPIDNVRGRLAVSKYKTEFRDFVGTSGGGVIRMNGQLVKTTEGNHLELGIEAKGAPLDEPLYLALPDGVRTAWKSVRPEGNVDLFCHLIKPPGVPLNISVRIDPHGATILPAAFPYRLENLEGMIDYRDGVVFWDELLARHGPVEITSTGSVRATADGGELVFSKLRSAQMPCDRDLRAALPAGLVSAVDFLQPDRPLEIDFKEVALRWHVDPRREIEYWFNGILRCQQTSLIPAVGVEKATGGVLLQGRGVGERVDARGNLELASAKIAGFAVTKVSTPLEIKGPEIRMGNILGEIYGGKLYGRLLVDTSMPGYDCHLTASGASLGKYLRDVMPKSAPVDGQVQVVLYMRNTGNNIATLNGDGRLYIRQADIYQSPVIQEVFRLLNFQAPNGRAFDEVDCNFRLKDRFVLIDSLELLGPMDIVGPSLSLFSDNRGTLNLDTMHIDLRLHPRWAKGRVRIPLISDVMNGASDQLITIPVTGPISNPTLMAEPVPGLRRILEGPVRAAPGVQRR